MARLLPVGVLVDRRAAGSLAPALRRLLRAAARSGLRVDEPLVELAEAFTEAERVLPDALPPTVCTAEAARIVGVSDRAVRLAAARGDLLGCLDGRRWQFARPDVDAWRVTRDRRGHPPPQGSEPIA